MEVVPGKESCCEVRFSNHGTQRGEGGSCRGPRLRNKFNLVVNFILTSTVQKVVSHVLVLLTANYHLVRTQLCSQKPEKRLLSQAENCATAARHCKLLFPDQPRQSSSIEGIAGGTVDLTKSTPANISPLERTDPGNRVGTRHLLIAIWRPG